jgi:ABC-type bacteriocin/lantibiotic exporter with double-glycine peptidase domain
MIILFFLPTLFLYLTVCRVVDSHRTRLIIIVFFFTLFYLFSALLIVVRDRFSRSIKKRGKTGGNCLDIFTEIYQWDIESKERN